MRRTNFWIMTVIVATLFVMILVFLSLSGDAAIGATPTDTAIESTQATRTTEADAPDPTATPTPTPIPEYIPEIGDLPESYWLDTMVTTLDGLTVTEIDSGYRLDWISVPEADYYIFCASYNGAEYIPLQILSPSVLQWEYIHKDVAGFMILAYTDNEQEGMADDVMKLACRSQIFEPQTTPEPPKDGGNGVPEKQSEKYKIIVDKEDCAFAVFEKDENGEYTVMVANFPAALGGRKTPLTTEKRQFSIGRKLEWRTWTGFSPDRYSPFASQYSAGIFFHGPIYRRKSFDTLIPYSYNDIGLDYKTGGCVRTTVAGARFVYYACAAGTVVEIYSSTDLVSYPGKIEIDPDFPGWDPTDPQKPTPSPTPAPTDPTAGTTSTTAQ